MQVFFRIFDALLDAMGALTAVLLALMTLGITAEILIRNLGLGSLPWIIEVVEYGLLAATFLAAPWVLKRSAHVRVDIVVENMPARLRRVADLIANGTGVVVCAIIFYYGLKSTISLYQLDTRIFKVLTIKEWWLFSLVPFSFAMMALEFMRRTARGRPEDAGASRIDEAGS